jgi:hypothetical protein
MMQGWTLMISTLSLMTRIGDLSPIQWYGYDEQKSSQQWD